jgi:hypothetical protein
MNFIGDKGATSLSESILALSKCPLKSFSINLEYLKKLKKY